jgi:hypothetical protein
LTTRPQSAYAAEEFSPCVFDEIVTRRLVKAAAGIAPAIKPIGRKRPARPERKSWYISVFVLHQT